MEWVYRGEHEEDQVRQPLPLDLLKDRSTVLPVLEAEDLLLDVLLQPPAHLGGSLSDLL